LNAAEPLTFLKVRSLYEVVWSDTGSNNRLLEEEAMFAFELVLQQCEGILQTVVQFG